MPMWFLNKVREILEGVTILMDKMHVKEVKLIMQLIGLIGTSRLLLVGIHFGEKVGKTITFFKVMPNGSMLQE